MILPGFAPKIIANNAYRVVLAGANPQGREQERGRATRQHVEEEGGANPRPAPPGRQP